MRLSHRSFRSFWSSRFEALCPLWLSSSISLKSACCSHKRRYGCTYCKLSLLTHYLSWNNMWECKEVVCVLAEWEKEPRSGNRNREVGMEENSGRGVDWMRDRVPVFVAMVCLISQVQKGYPIYLIS